MHEHAPIFTLRSNYIYHSPLFNVYIVKLKKYVENLFGYSTCIKYLTSSTSTLAPKVVILKFRVFLDFLEFS